MKRTKHENYIIDMVDVLDGDNIVNVDYTVRNKHLVINITKGIKFNIGSYIVLCNAMLKYCKSFQQLDIGDFKERAYIFDNMFVFVLA